MGGNGKGHEGNGFKQGDVLPQIIWDNESTGVKANKSSDTQSDELEAKGCLFRTYM